MAGNGQRLKNDYACDGTAICKIIHVCGHLITLLEKQALKHAERTLKQGIVSAILHSLKFDTLDL